MPPMKPARISSVTDDGDMALQPKGMVISEKQADDSEKYSTMVGVFSVRTSCRTCTMATAASAAEKSTAKTPDNWLGLRLPSRNKVRLGHRMTSTPTKPAMTAPQR